MVSCVLKNCTMKLSDIKAKEIQPGLYGKMVHGKQLTWAFWEVDEGAEVPLHEHHHEQIMHVVTGRFEFCLDGKTRVCNAGEVVVIPSHTPHAGKALTPCQLMDIFTPVREDYQ